METEKRLIDANALLLSIRTTLVRSKQKYAKNPIISDILDSFDELVIGKVKKAPTVDAVEVVRCKDCKYGKPMIGSWDNKVWCGYHKCFYPEDGFCSYGERKDND